MATIEKRKCGDGFSYRCSIRKKGIEIYKTFKTEEDAKLYVFYKERLIDNMENFEVPLSHRITLEQLFEIKRKEFFGYDRRTLNDLDLVYAQIKNCLIDKVFYHEYTYEDWLECVKKMYQLESWRGSKTNVIKISPRTLRRKFGVVSSVISCAISKGIEIENHALKVMQTYINPML